MTIEYVHNKKYIFKNVTVILAPRLKKWYVDHVDHMWTIFQSAPNIHVDRLVHMVHMPKSQPWLQAAAGTGASIFRTHVWAAAGELAASCRPAARLQAGPGWDIHQQLWVASPTKM